FLTVLGSGDHIWADEQTPQTAPAMVAPATPNPPVKDAPPSAGHVSLRDRLFHSPLFTHGKAPCPGCSPANDPDMGCGTCHSEWSFSSAPAAPFITSRTITIRGGGDKKWSMDTSCARRTY